MDVSLFIRFSIVKRILVQGIILQSIQNVVSTNNTTVTSMTPTESDISISTVTMNYMSTLTSEKVNKTSVISSTFNTTTENPAKGHILISILVPASIIALVGFVILAYLILRCFKTVLKEEDAVHLTGRDTAKDSEHQIFGLFNTSYNGTSANEQNTAKDRTRKRSIFELNESHVIKRPEPAYINIDIPIDTPSSEEEKVTLRTKETIIPNKSNTQTEEAKTSEATYNHIVITDDEGNYNRLTLKCHDTKFTKLEQSTPEELKYDNSAVVKSSKTFEDSYSRLSSVVSRKKPLLRHTEKLDESVNTTVQWSTNINISDSPKKPSETIREKEKDKQKGEENKPSYIYSKVNKTFKVDKKEGTKDSKQKTLDVGPYEANKPNMEKKSCPNNIKAFDVSTDSSQTTDINGYSIVKSKETEIKTETKADSVRNVKPCRNDGYSEVVHTADKKSGDFPYDGIEIHSEKFFIVTDN